MNKKTQQANHKHNLDLINHRFTTDDGEYNDVLLPMLDIAHIVDGKLVLTTSSTSGWGTTSMGYVPSLDSTRDDIIFIGHDRNKDRFFYSLGRNESGEVVTTLKGVENMLGFIWSGRGFPTCHFCHDCGDKIDEKNESTKGVGWGIKYCRSCVCMFGACTLCTSLTKLDEKICLNCIDTIEDSPLDFLTGFPDLLNALAEAYRSNNLSAVELAETGA